MNETALTYRRYKDGDYKYEDMTDLIFSAGRSAKCPTYIHRTPPCQAACPSGHDIRGWMNVVRGLDKPADGMAWEEYAFRRMTKSNPFPAIMGRVCPHPCEDNCNRREVDEHIGINSIEQFIGDWALEHHLAFPKPKTESGKKVAIIGGGPAGLAAAYFLRLRGHACTIFERQEKLGGMMRYGIPGYRTPRQIVDGEIQRILDMGVEVRTGTRIGTHVTVEQLEKDFDAIFWGIGAQSGQPLRVPGANVSNCVSGLAFLEAFNQGRLAALSGRVLVIGGGDTAMDVAAVAKRIGEVEDEGYRPEDAIIGKTVHDVATVARRKGADVWIVYRRPIERAPASKEEIEAVRAEGVEIHESLAPVEVLQDENGRASALRVVPVDWIDNREMVPKTGQEIDIKCSLIVAATGQTGDFTGIEEFDNGKGLMNSDGAFQVRDKPGHFLAGDIIRPHVMTAAIGDSWRATESIDAYLRGQEAPARPRVDGHRFDMLETLAAAGLAPAEYDHEPARATDSAAFSLHNYEDRSDKETVSVDRLFLGHFQPEARHRRTDMTVSADEILGNFNERTRGLTEADAIAEAQRCMSCGLCIECDNCLVYCPQHAVSRVAKDKRTPGRYVETDYNKCIGCHICKDVCPTGYIHMGLGE